MGGLGHLGGGESAINLYIHLKIYTLLHVLSNIQMNI